jgi:hypothetical protein
MSKDSLTSSIMDLLTEEVRTPPNAPVARRVVEEFPDALVLCEIVTICKLCGTKWLHPNLDILARYDRNCKKIKEWSSLFEQIPREILSIENESRSCSKCFESAVLRTSDVEGSEA